MDHFAAIVPASGSSTRYGRNKLLEPFAGGTVFGTTLRALLSHGACAAVYVAATDPAVLAQVRTLVPDAHKPIYLERGGETRAHSVLSALRTVREQYEWVTIHDAARPLLSPELIDRTFAAAVKHGAAVPALPVKLTIKQATGPLPARVQRTVPRHELWEMQTPQIMRRQDLLDAYERCPLPLEQVTDDVQLLELIGKDVWLVPGDERNLKITTPIDLLVAEALQKA
jgi:2-C-methyl-D-erythritol 4-phosphate cytidylyltransferase